MMSMEAMSILCVVNYTLSTKKMSIDVTYCRKCGVRYAFKQKEEELCYCGVDICFHCVARRSGNDLQLIYTDDDSESEEEEAEEVNDDDDE